MTLVNTTLSSLDRAYISHMFRKFGVPYNMVYVSTARRKCIDIDINDIKKMIELYDERLANNYNANYVTTRKRWIKIYNELRG